MSPLLGGQPTTPRRRQEKKDPLQEKRVQLQPAVAKEVQSFITAKRKEARAMVLGRCGVTGWTRAFRIEGSRGEGGGSKGPKLVAQDEVIAHPTFAALGGLCAAVGVICERAWLAPPRVRTSCGVSRKAHSLVFHISFLLCLTSSSSCYSCDRPDDQVRRRAARTHDGLGRGGGLTAGRLL